jgi:hypothetical protein
MPHQDEGAREMKHAQEIVEPVFPPDCKAAVILEPRKQYARAPSLNRALDIAFVGCQNDDVSSGNSFRIAIIFSQPEPALGVLPGGGVPS